MSNIILAFCVITGALSFNYYKKLCNPYTVFNVLWIVVLSLTQIGHPNYYAPSAAAFMCIYIGIAGFNIPFYFWHIKVQLKINGNKIFHRFEANTYSFHIKRLYLIAYFLMIYYAYRSIHTINILMNEGGFALIRTSFFQYQKITDLVNMIFMNYFITPFRYVLVSAVIIMFYEGRKDKKLLIYALTCVLGDAFISGGRSVLLSTIYIVLCCYSLYFNKKSFSFKQRIYTIALFFIFAYLIIYLTGERTALSNELGLFDKIRDVGFSYFAASLTYLTRMLENVEFYQFGLILLHGFIRIFIRSIDILGILPYESIFPSMELTYTVYQIGPEIYSNALPTVFGYFYLDGGFIAVFIESVIISLVIKRAYENSNKGYLYYKVQYTLLFLMICNWSMKYLAVAPAYCFAFLYAQAILSNRKDELAV